MPFLVLDGARPEDNVLLVHVPRCAGTSMVRHLQVEKKAVSTAPRFWNRVWLRYFFYRYTLLERNNFPIWTYENAWALTLIVVAFILMGTTPDWGVPRCESEWLCPPPMSLWFWVMGSLTFTVQTFVGNTTMCRVDWMRRALMHMCKHLLLHNTRSLTWINGVDENGLLPHMTPERMVRFKYIERPALRRSLAVVRNPYARMYSVYQYNRRGRCEGFPHFVRQWYGKWQRFKANGSTEEKHVYCHVLPMVEYTHSNGEQYVPYILRQEDLKALSRADAKTSDLFRDTYSGIPDFVMGILQGLPHKNARKGSIKWSDLYTQECMDTVLEMYAEDFEMFAYPTTIKGRPDLKPAYVRPLGHFPAVPPDLEACLKGNLKTHLGRRSSLAGQRHSSDSVIVMQDSLMV